MHFEGSEEIKAPRTAVWDFVTDPDRIGHCAPGVEQVAVIEDGRFDVIAKVGIGVVSARFRAAVEMATPTPGEDAEVRVRAVAPGSAVDGIGRIQLADIDSGTRMDWRADVQLSGRFASLGSRLIEGAARQMIGQAFNRIKAGIELQPAEG